MRMAFLLLLSSCLCSLPSQESSAGRPLVLRGLDPVALCEGVEIAGSEAWTAEDHRYTYRFATAVARARFLAAPERFGVQWGGACGRMGPMSGRGSLERFAVHDGKIFLFASDGCRSGFLSAPDRFLPANPPSHPEPTEDAKQAGRALLERVVEAHGGKALDSVASVIATRTTVSSGWTTRVDLEWGRTGDVQFTMRVTPPATEANAPSEYHWRVGRESLSRDRAGQFELSSAEITDVLRLAHRHPAALLMARHLPGFQVSQLTVVEPLSDQSGIRLRVVWNGLSTILLVDPDKGSVLGMEWEGRLQDGVTRKFHESFSNWQPVDGVLLPHGRSVVRDGQREKATTEMVDQFQLTKE